MGKIQIGLCRKEQNLEAIRDELRARHVQFDDNTNFTDLKNLLKAHEKERMRNEASTYDKRYFAPLTPYENFKWNSSHIE